MGTKFPFFYRMKFAKHSEELSPDALSPIFFPTKILFSSAHLDAMNGQIVIYSMEGKYNDAKYHYLIYPDFSTIRMGLIRFQEPDRYDLLPFLQQTTRDIKTIIPLDEAFFNSTVLKIRCPFVKELQLLDAAFKSNEIKIPRPGMQVKQQWLQQLASQLEQTEFFMLNLQRR